MSFYDAIDNANSFSIGFGDHPKQLFGLFAKGYAKAASTLASDLLARDFGFRDYEAYPVVFLYRHALELALKNILIKPARLIAFTGVENLQAKLCPIHDLVKLSNSAAVLLRGLFPRDTELKKVIHNMLGIAAEFADVDPGSFAYRYPVDKNGNMLTKPNQTVNLDAFSSTR